jgi:sugar-specific transcriptional regulator TrmB
MIEELINLGLSEQEAEIYVYLTKEKNQTASKIAEKTKINRSVTYGILESLIVKGLVNYVLMGGVKKFSSTKPEMLVDFMKDKEESLKKILPLLNSLKSEGNETVNVEVFKGKNGGLVVMKDILKTSNKYVAFGEDKSFQQVMGTLAKQYIRKLNEGKIKERLLVPEGQKVLVGKNTEVKYLPKNISIPSITAIYGNKVAISIFQEPYYAIVIESKELSLTYLSLFEFLWKNAKTEHSMSRKV